MHDLRNRDTDVHAFKSGLKSFYKNARYPIFMIVTIRDLGNLRVLNVKELGPLMAF